MTPLTTSPRHAPPPGRNRTRCAHSALLAIALLAATGCLQEMSDQPRVETYEATTAFEDGLSVREPVPGTIARGRLVEDTALTTGLVGEKPVEQLPVEMTAALLERGRGRFGIFCKPCHGPAGHGDGMVVQRGFPEPPSYHIDRLRTAPVGALFRVVTEGRGRMPPFGNRISPEDRWAILAWVRVLQTSQNIPVSELSETDRKALEQLTPSPQQ